MTLGTSNSKVSPVIDLDRTNANVVRNLIDNPNPTGSDQGVVTGTLSLRTPVSSITTLTNKALLGFKNTVDNTTYNVTVKSYNPTTGKITVQGRNVGKLASPEFTDVTIESIGSLSLIHI